MDEDPRLAPKGEVLLNELARTFLEKRAKSPEHFTYINGFAGDIMLRQSRPKIQPLRWG
jgi:hypothetical protein